MVGTSGIRLERPAAKTARGISLPALSGACRCANQQCHSLDFLAHQGGQAGGFTHKGTCVAGKGLPRSSGDRGTGLTDAIQEQSACSGLSWRIAYSNQSVPAKRLAKLPIPPCHTGGTQGQQRKQDQFCPKVHPHRLHLRILRQALPSARLDEL